MKHCGDCYFWEYRYLDKPFKVGECLAGIGGSHLLSSEPAEDEYGKLCGGFT